MKRMWINQPHAADPLRHYHGMNVLAVQVTPNSIMIWPTTGDIVSMLARPDTLSDGWSTLPAPAPMPKDPTTLTCLQAAVAAKVAYWDANRDLEVHLGYVEDIPDAVSGAIEDAVSILAVECDTADAAHEVVEDEHVAYLMAELSAI